VNRVNKTTQKPLKVICFGMGAIGTYIGGSLAANGAEVVFIERPEFVGEASSRGIRLTINENEIVIPKIQVTADIGKVLAEDPADVALLAVKSFDTQAVMDSLTGFVDQFPPILCLQNGVENEGLIAKKLGEDKVIGGTITSAVGRSGLGAVKLERLRGVGIEATHPISQKLIDWFNLSGLQARGYANRADMKWSKMLTNLLANATSAILDWTPAQVFSDPVTWKIELEQIREALSVMKALQIQLVNLPGTPAVALFSLLRFLPATLSQSLIGTPLAKGRGAKMPSFHIDLHSGRGQSEVQFLNGAVASHARELGLKALVNERLCDLLLKMTDGSVSKADYANNPHRLDSWIRGTA